MQKSDRALSHSVAISYVTDGIRCYSSDLSLPGKDWYRCFGSLEHRGQASCFVQGREPLHLAEIFIVGVFYGHSNERAGLVDVSGPVSSAGIRRFGQVEKAIAGFFAVPKPAAVAGRFVGYWKSWIAQNWPIRQMMVAIVMNLRRPRAR